MNLKKKIDKLDNIHKQELKESEEYINSNEKDKAKVMEKINELNKEKQEYVKEKQIIKQELNKKEQELTNNKIEINNLKIHKKVLEKELDDMKKNYTLKIKENN